jgi:bifunctional pyridoxal-dependent enzyme with beta-cystathionase and maltose regulon repressor activities
VIHGSAYGPGGEGFLRVSFAAGGETLERGLKRLRDGLIRLSADIPDPCEAEPGSNRT